jgi:2-methylisocitrate lyase-like PEP mutase family enzyme
MARMLPFARAHTADATESQLFQQIMRSTSRLKAIVERRAATIVPGVANAMFARAVEDLGFEAVYVTGAGIANMEFGVPDIGLTTMTEVADIVARLASAVSIPIIVDADTGFGSPLNVVRTVRIFERAGAAGIQIEDQIFPKKCGHFAGKEVVPIDNMLDKIHAAVDTRHDADLQIIARTDARAVEGLDRAIERAQAFLKAGADAIFIEAPISVDELARIPREVRAPQIANMVFGGKTPNPGRAKLAEMGFSIVLYANVALQAALKASYDVLRALREDGTLVSVQDRLASFEERQRAVGKPEWDALEAKYRAQN